MQQRVPVLDLERLDADSEPFIAEAGAAYREFGFADSVTTGFLTGSLMTPTGPSTSFLHYPREVKAAYCSVDGGQRGYTPFGTERARDNPVPDLKEFWHTGREMTGDNPWPDIMRANQWPAEIPHFKAAMLALYQQLDALGLRILGIIARSLGLAESWFDEPMRRGNSILRAIHYPPLAEGPSPGRTRRPARGHQPGHLVDRFQRSRTGDPGQGR